MGGGVPKQFRDFGGRPLLKATIEAFLGPEMPTLSGVSLAVPLDRMEEAKSWAFGIPTWVAEGGLSRQASVQAALSLLPDEPEATVLIHDAVRPFPPAGPVTAAIHALESWDGALLGEPSTDTLKRVDSQGRVMETVPRKAIFRAQTPQVALLGTWRRAFAWAEKTGFEATDDVSLLEALGWRVLMVPSQASNLKITTHEDWNWATECGR
ncbi:MAG: 2-C-methyl-D-erythritol 4-phosphate cytidylyltransferase [Holophagaceae bacterium]|nr:2-C-methyl-D-erythritol 4-phosphate cytidylyltransferase [Holophagaceae bacterium]